MRITLFLLLICIVTHTLCLSSRLAETEDDDFSLMDAADSVYNHSYYAVLRGATAFSDISSLSSAKTCQFSSGNSNQVQVKLAWTFPFYGHSHNYLYITPYGMIKMFSATCGTNGSPFCFWDANTGYDRYLAPFASDFDPSSGIVQFVDNGMNRLVIQWTNMTLARTASNAPSSSLASEKFTFQLDIRSSGQFFFHYASIPYDPTARFVMYNITTWVPLSTTTPSPANAYKTYPVVIGCEDLIFRQDDFVTINIRYAALSLSTSAVMPNNGNYYTLTLNNLPTCLSFTDCTSCLNFRASGSLECGWCSAASICSDGMGREIAEIPNACDPTTLSTTTASCSPVVAVDDSGNVDAGTVAIGAAAAISVCVVGVLLYIRNRKKQSALERMQSASTVQHAPPKMRSKKGFAFETEDEESTAHA